MPVVQIRIGPGDHGRAMTLDEFREAEEEPGFLYELARGVLAVGEVPGDEHGQVVDNLHLAVDVYRMRNRGRLLRIAHGSDIRPIIPELDSDRHPDLAIVFRDAPLSPRGRQIPKGICEVVSPGKKARRRDDETKSEEYLTLGIGEYRIVDPLERKVTVRIREEGAEGPAWSERDFAGDEVIVSTLLPGLEGTVADLWVNVEPEPENGDGE